MVTFLKPVPGYSVTSSEENFRRMKRCSEVLRLAESVVHESKSIIAKSKALVVESRILLERTPWQTLR